MAVDYKRPDWDEYFLNIAEEVGKRSTCLRRRYGAIIVKDNIIVSTGYNGSPRGEINCLDAKICERERLHIPKGERYELCVAVHAEQNAICQAARRGIVRVGGKRLRTYLYRRGPVLSVKLEIVFHVAGAVAGGIMGNLGEQVAGIGAAVQAGLAAVRGADAGIPFQAVVGVADGLAVGIGHGGDGAFVRVCDKNLAVFADCL